MNRESVSQVFIDPSYKVFCNDRLFDMSDVVLNRDGQLEPIGRLRGALTQKGIEVHTADLLFGKECGQGNSDYYSLGLLDNYRKLITRDDIRLRAFVVMEPPVVSPKLYRALPELTRTFDRVYVHNVSGDGYSLRNVDRSRLRKLYWPQPYDDVLPSFWKNVDRQRRLVVINGNHMPRSFKRELYSHRIEAMAALAKVGAVDLYGHGWTKWWSHRSMWLPYWLNRRVLMSIYRGSCISKYAVLSRYAFSLCFENMQMEGYLTEKIFDCLYAGTIPVYLGASNISELVPESVYVDCRKYKSWIELWDGLCSMSDVQIKSMKEAGREFIRSEAMKKYYNALPEIFSNSFG